MKKTTEHSGTARGVRDIREQTEEAKTRAPASDSVTGPREVIEQAERDVSSGLVDTDRRGTPSNVPGPRRSRQRRAEVPPDGGNRASYSDRRRSKRPDDDPAARK